MHEWSVFSEVEKLRGRTNGSAVSIVALEIHVRAIDRSVHTTFPAFVPDDDLDMIAPGQVTTIAALELCLAGMWHRAKDGYVVSDFDFIEHMSMGPVRRRLRSARSRWTKRTIAACHHAWDVLNRDNFVPL
ncbi:hypothetical protein BH09ACT7_BH09ACT7_01300 [soil metagenome]